MCRTLRHILPRHEMLVATHFFQRMYDTFFYDTLNCDTICLLRHISSSECTTHSSTTRDARCDTSDTFYFSVQAQSCQFTNLGIDFLSFIYNYNSLIDRHSHVCLGIQEQIFFQLYSLSCREETSNHKLWACLLECLCVRTLLISQRPIQE